MQVTRRQTAPPSYEQLAATVQELYVAVGELFAALAPFSGPRNMVNAGGQPLFLVSADERSIAYSARMSALRRVTAAGLVPPLGPQPAPPTIPMVPRQGPFGPHH